MKSIPYYIEKFQKKHAKMKNLLNKCVSKNSQKYVDKQILKAVCVICISHGRQGGNKGVLKPKLMGKVHDIDKHKFKITLFWKVESF